MMHAYLINEIEKAEQKKYINEIKQSELEKLKNALKE